MLNSDLENLEVNYPEFVLKHPNCFKGIQVPKEWPDGWDDLVFEMMDEMEKLMLSDLDKYKYCRILQINERDGHLRIYLFRPNDELIEIADRYRELSMYTCMYCGDIGLIEKNHGWSRCVCPKHSIFWKHLIELELICLPILKEKYKLEKIKFNTRLANDSKKILTTIYQLREVFLKFFDIHYVDEESFVEKKESFKKAMLESLA